MDSEFYIFDVSGKVLKHGRVTGKNTTIDIANLRVGVYILLVNGREKSFTKKIIAQ
ncbi:MAG: T9SS type A sorting domain-containing protein [Bacteroidales bacterium]|nr:T9SS type A sorting domain-containing protein [Bacteroidales bacterium]